MDPGKWAEQEFGQAQWGDQRLTKRLVVLATQRAAMPNASVPQSCQNLAGTRAAYRFYDNDQIEVEQILEPHRRASLQRLQGRAVVLAVQDTTQVDLTDHPHTQGTGYLQDLKHTGFLLHSTLWVTPQREPLGLIQQQVWIRDPADFGKKHQRDKRLITEKESQKWLTSLQAVADVQKKLRETQLVSVGDCEADLYALCGEAQRLEQSFLVRACRDRLIEDEAEKHLWKYLTKQPMAGTLEVALPCQADRPARTATLSIRFAQVILRVPLREVKQGYPQITAWVILAQEEMPAPLDKPITWKLLTNIPTQDLAQAIERVNWYSCRWVVEMFHRVLKSGCRIEKRQFDDLNNTRRFLGVDSVVAWRVLYQPYSPTDELHCLAGGL